MRSFLLSSVLRAHDRTPHFRGKLSLVRLGQRLMGEVPVRTAWGVRMLSTPKDFTNSLSVTGAYTDVYSFLDFLEPGMCFIDVGANAGVFSLVAAQRVGPEGSVIAFEPSPPMFRRLVHNAELNGVANFFPLQVALGEKTQLVKFHPGGAAHTGLAHVGDDGTCSVIQSTYKDLETIISPLIGDRKIAIKIDVEGYELNVARSLLPLFGSSRISFVIVEVDHEYLSRSRATATELYALMNSAGFRAEIGYREAGHYNELFRRD